MSPTPDATTIEPRLKWGKWKLTSPNTLLHTGLNYDVPLSEINDHRELLDWLFHVGSKAEVYEPTAFAAAMRAIFRPAVRMPSFSGKELAADYITKELKVLLPPDQPEEAA